MLSRVIDISGCITAVIVRENRGEDKRCRLCIQLYKHWRPYPKGYYIVHNEQVPEAAVFFVCIFVGDTWAIHIEVCLNGSSESWEDLERSHQGWQIQLYQNRTHLPTNQRQQYQGKLYCNLENKAIFPPKPNVKKKKKKKEQNKPMPHLLPCENLLLLVCVCVYNFFFLSFGHRCFPELMPWLCYAKHVWENQKHNLNAFPPTFSTSIQMRSWVLLWVFWCSTESSMKVVECNDQTYTFVTIRNDFCLLIKTEFCSGVHLRPEGRTAGE